MGELIKGIYIEKSNLPNDVPVEECEKVEDGFVYRFQRRTDVSALERFFRIFSDLFDGVTKAQDRLCKASEKLPDLISIKGHQIPIKSQSADGAIGVSTSHEKPWPKAFDTIDIFFRRGAADTLTAAAPAVRADNRAQPTKQAPPAPPSRAGRPPLGHADNGAPPVKSAPPSPPSRAGRPPLGHAENGDPPAKPAPPSREGRPALGNHADAQGPLPAANALPDPPEIQLPAPPPRLTEAALAAMTAEEAAPAPMPRVVAPQDQPPPAPPLPANQANPANDVVPPAPPMPAKVVMNEAPPAPAMPEKVAMNEAPPAPPMPEKPLTAKAATTASEPIGDEVLQNAIKRLKKTTHDPADRKKAPPEDPNNLAEILRKKIASMHPAFEDEKPTNAQEAKDEWDE